MVQPVLHQQEANAGLFTGTAPAAEGEPVFVVKLCVGVAVTDSIDRWMLEARPMSGHAVCWLSGDAAPARPPRTTWTCVFVLFTSRKYKSRGLTLIPVLL